MVLKLRMSSVRKPLVQVHICSHWCKKEESRNSMANHAAVQSLTPYGSRVWEEDEEAKRSAENHFEECWGRTSTTLAGECGVGVFHPIFAPLSRYVFALYRLRQSL
jgi:hypothetical protein